MPSELDDLWTAIDDLQAGLFRAPVGPGGIRAKAIKPKSVYASTINVSDLQSVNTKTGNLSITGSITLTTAGNIHAGQAGYDSGIGYWLEFNGGTPRFSLGNSGGNKLLWDGTSLSITGTITATTGTIGGWTIGTTDLQGSGGVIGLASSGSIRIWSGNATPSAAPFRVDSFGNLTATAGFVGGWSIDSTLGLKLGTTTNTRGISTGSTAFYAGSDTPSTAPFHVNTNGDLVASSAIIVGTISTSNITATGGTIGGITINAGSLTSANWGVTSAGVMTSTSGTVGGLTIGANDLTVPAGKKLKFGASAADYLDNNILHFESNGADKAVIEFKNGANTPKVQYEGYVSSAAAVARARAYYDTNQYSTLQSAADSTSGSATVAVKGQIADGTTALIGAAYSVGSKAYIICQLGDAAGTSQLKVVDINYTQVFGVNSSGDLIRPIANNATALGAYYGRVPIYINGVLKYLPVYS